MLNWETSKQEAHVYLVSFSLMIIIILVFSQNGPKIAAVTRYRIISLVKISFYDIINEGCIEYISLYL